MLEYICPNCHDLFSYKCKCPECDMMVVRNMRVDNLRIKRKMKSIGHIEDDGPSDEQMEYFKRGGR
jgi:hypothetical protein